MIHRLATIVVCIGLSSTAQAVEWSMHTTLRETLEASDNPFMFTVPAAALGSHSTVFGTITGQTKTSRFDFDGDFTYNKYWGPGADLASTLAETNENGVKLHYETFGKVPKERNFIDAIWRRRSAALAVLNDFGVPSNASGDIHTTTIQGGIDRALTPTDFWGWTSRATSTDYQPPSGGTQYYDVATTSSFRHQSNSTSALTALSELEWLKYDNSTRTNIMIIRQMAGVDLKPFKNLSFVASAGAATVITDQGTSPIATNPFAPLPSQGTATGFIGDGTLTYAFAPTTELTLTAGQSISPSITGVLTQRQYAGASVRYQVNARTSVTTRLDLTRQILSDAQTDFLTASATYSHILARDWTLDLTYRYSHRGATTGTATVIFDPLTGIPIFLNGASSGSASSNTVLFMLSRRFVVLPKRT